MDKANDQIYVEHILQAIVGIETFTRGLSFDDFTGDLKTQLAITRELEIIGEASKRLSPAFKSNLGNIPWKKITDMRNFLIHDYLDIDLEIVWKAATEDIAELKHALEQAQSEV